MSRSGHSKGQLGGPSCPANVAVPAQLQECFCGFCMNQGWRLFLSIPNTSSRPQWEEAISWAALVAAGGNGSADKCRMTTACAQPTGLVLLSLVGLGHATVLTGCLLRTAVSTDGARNRMLR